MRGCIDRVPVAHQAFAYPRTLKLIAPTSAIVVATALSPRAIRAPRGGNSSRQRYRAPLTITSAMIGPIPQTNLRGENGHTRTTAMYRITNSSVTFARLAKSIAPATHNV